jgi:hypothetical protein
LKRQVVKSMSNFSLWVRELLGGDFLKVLNYSYGALRLPVHPVVEAMEGKWGSRGTVEKRRDTLPWVGQACGE